jgi:DNA-binding protein HU-beta
MNKAQLVEALASRTQLTKVQSENVLDAAIEIIQGAVSAGEGVKLVGFGSFTLADRKARTGRNPQTGQTFNLPATRVPRFRPGKEFKQFVSRPSDKKIKGAH